MFFVLTKNQPSTQQRLILGLAFNEALLLKMIKFLEVYGGLNALLVRDDL